MIGVFCRSSDLSGVCRGGDGVGALPELCNSQPQVDDLEVKAVADGDCTYDAAQDLGFVYTHGFLDADGNAWRLNFMNPEVQMPE